MDLYQQKLSKLEWESIEIPVTKEEKRIIKFIKESYGNVNNKYNDNLSLLGYIKIADNDINNYYLYNKYFKEKIEHIVKKFNLNFSITTSVKKKDKPKKIDQMKIDNNDTGKNYSHIFEYVFIEICEKFLEHINNDSSKYVYYYYTICKFRNLAIPNINTYVMMFNDYIINTYVDDINIHYVIENSQTIIEKNNYINKFSDIELFNHQKEIFTIFKKKQVNYNYNDTVITELQPVDPKLILYIAPTATGKTLTPIGLSEEYKVIFVCAARHVGLALAKSAISVGKKIALAFNCSDASNIRLNYAAGNSWFTHEFNNYENICSCGRKKCSLVGQYFTYKDGSRKIDHTDGRAVEIIICDIKSYIPAMYYMNAFNKANDIITFWDEPTITMDEATHPLHEIIKNNWKNNIIPNVVLSSATLPKEEEIRDTIVSFINKFKKSSVHSIVSHDCKKSIPVLNKDNEVCVPHLLWDNYNDLLKCVEHCENYKTILRYFDLSEIAKFLVYVDKKKYISNERYFIERYFSSIEEINMYTLKNYYLLVLKNIDPDKWSKIYKYSKEKYEKLYESTGHFITKDSYTLTDGPTIFLAEDINKIAKFCTQQAKIPVQIMKEINESIEFNNKLTDEISKIEKTFEDLSKEKDNEGNSSVKKKEKDDKEKLTKEQRVLKNKIDDLQRCIKSIELNDLFIPNKKEHINKWAKDKITKTSFSCDISEAIVVKIMLLKNVDDIWKILLLMGIGVFIEHENGDYTQIMKDLAMNQQLFMIIASSNYIYGTNYQFCHGYVGKDLENMTQEKTIQALGRIGRSNFQQTYSVRFRDNSLVNKLFVKEENKPEVINMNKLFNDD